MRAREFPRHGLYFDRLGPIPGFQERAVRYPHVVRSAWRTDIFAVRDGAGVLAQRVPGVANTEHGMENSPGFERARARGELVRKLGTEGRVYSCCCDVVRDCNGVRRIDLGDPFVFNADRTVS